MGDADRRLATELVYGVLRQRTRLDRALASVAPRGLAKLSPAVFTALRVAAYQLLFLDRVPAHAAINDAVSAVRAVGGGRMSGFANGLLRRLDREGEPQVPGADSDDYAEIALSMPRWLTSLLARELSPKELPAATLALSQPAPLCIRVNRRRSTKEDLALALTQERQCTIEVPQLGEHALLLTGFGSPDASASFQAGLFTVQDLGAQLVTLLCRPRAGERVLDACAGVGGKTTYLAELTDELRIDAADLSRRKLDLLEDSARRLGATGIQPIEVDLRTPGTKLAKTYDSVLLDAPCTGLGVLRRHPELRWRCDNRGDEMAERIRQMAALQRELLDSVAPHVGPGGALVYSVCTFTQEEGPLQIASFLERHPEFRPVDWLRTWPHHHPADAFFAVRLERSTRPW